MNYELSRSADAAHDVRARIEASSKSVEQGSELSQQAGEHTRAIMQAATQVEHLMAQMAKASEEQRRGIEEVNVAVTQIDATTQDTMRLVNQTAQSAEGLTQEALQMREYAGQFRIIEEAPVPDVHDDEEAEQPLEQLD